MREVRSSSLILAAGLGVSLAGHAALGFGFARLSDKLENVALTPGELTPARVLKPPDTLRMELEQQRAQEPEEDREIQLGIDDGSAATLTWLGFREATEHAALRGVVDQSEMTLRPGVPGEGTPVPNRAVETPMQEEVAARPSEVPEQLPMVAVPTETEPSNEEVSEPEEDDPPASEVPVDESPAKDSDSAEVPAQASDPPPPLSQEAQREIAERIALEATQAAERLAQSLSALIPERTPVRKAPARAPQAQAAPPVNVPVPGGGGMPGIESDRESIATAVREAPVVRPGRVLAAKGLEILTRRPRFTMTTRMTQDPRNPVVEITFGRDGRVKRARFLSDGKTTYSTGSEDVDQALMNAIYSWTAKGKVLKEIDAEDPDAGVSVVITIVLVG